MAPTEEWWETVKREVRDMLVPGLAERTVEEPAADSPLQREVRRQIEPTTLLEALPTAITAKPEVAEDDGTLALAPTSSSSAITTNTIQTTSAIAATRTPSPTGAPSQDNGGGGDNGVAAKAGIAIGVLGGILVVFVLGWLIVSMRKKKLAQQRQQMEDDEKIHGPFSDNAAVSPVRQAPSKAPRLSLRRVSGFLPGFTSPSSGSDNRASRGMNMALNPVFNTNANSRSAAAASPSSPSAWERPALRLNTDRPGTSASLHPNNPFHDRHHVSDDAVSPVSSMGSFDRRVGVGKTSDAIPEPVSPIIDNDDSDDDGSNYNDNNQHHLGVTSIARKTSIRKDLPKPLDLTKPASPGPQGFRSPASPGGSSMVPPSPAGTEYSMHSMAPGQVPGPSASAAAIAAAGGPAHSTVHRVQLDFKPSLHDEMELKVGQLVRLLHEYDDGWVRLLSPPPFPFPSLDHQTNNHTTGPLHPPRPLRTRRRPPHLPLHPPRQTAQPTPTGPTTTTTTTRKQPARRPACQQLVLPLRPRGEPKGAGTGKRLRLRPGEWPYKQRQPAANPHRGRRVQRGRRPVRPEEGVARVAGRCQRRESCAWAGLLSHYLD
ncbi:hypothetical protein VTJ49DRAFT_7162 [Mycothermus thermophilus]|uniref:SH3 domain-containing protein n=1 Tax=Humicola insolens TaxID=85995 RepID=A0ABR3VHN9_HUMIN